MPTFDELKQRYMATSTDGGGGSLSPTPGTPIAVHQNCRVQALINGVDYFRDLRAEINSLGTAPTDGQFIYIAGWWCGRDFSLDGAGSMAALADLLIQKSRAGVDVRVLGWVMAPEVMTNPSVRGNPGLGSILGLNGDTMSFVRRLQAEPTLTHKASLNILAHPAGAAHAKMAVLGSNAHAIGFTGGLDLQEGRFSPHWRDVQTHLTGPATQNFFDAFQAMWNEVRGRAPVSLTAPSSQMPGSPSVTVTSHTTSMPALAARTLVSPSPGRMHVQGVRTLPRFVFATGGSLVSMPRNAPLSFAPQGLFEVKAVWEKALRAAQTYIFIEDQGFISHEVFDWANAALRRSRELKVILITGQPDPNDAPNSWMSKMFSIAVNAHLLAGLSAADRDRVALFSHLTDTIHSKTSIVDDHWAIIGSANAMRRSLYTDFEHAIAFMDEAGAGVPNYRATLWGGYLGASVPDVAGALTRFFAIPYRVPGASPHASGLERMRLPLPSATLTAEEQAFANEIYDCDSRETWGDDLAQMYVRMQGAQLLSP